LRTLQEKTEGKLVAYIFIVQISEISVVLILSARCGQTVPKQHSSF